MRAKRKQPQLKILAEIKCVPLITLRFPQSHSTRQQARPRAFDRVGPSTVKNPKRRPFNSIFFLMLSRTGIRSQIARAFWHRIQ
jgi:hypothetical protein